MIKNPADDADYQFSQFKFQPDAVFTQAEEMDKRMKAMMDLGDGL